MLMNRFYLFFFIINMINKSYLQYIPVEMREKLHYNLMVDVYYLYHGYKPTGNQKIICLNDNIFDLKKNNLVLISF
jgi:hypothetical protein